ncbi:hypothetical protein DdX_04529 [Ditylenchus destructor]|uniref:Uncharacterized protein n=1 Tax=Ditylenchus destructor TaxID=166010 RepID=A0AAD4ND84_9BILA|nr:hypothetical protein DdX_04529 [Ditylenchus destructor]
MSLIASLRITKNYRLSKVVFSTSTPQVIDFCCAKDGMARSKLPSIAPHNEVELRKMLVQMKENVGQDIVELKKMSRFLNRDAACNIPICSQEP